jgi:hypothetical protein
MEDTNKQQDVEEESNKDIEIQKKKSSWNPWNEKLNSSHKKLKLKALLIEWIKLKTQYQG